MSDELHFGQQHPYNIDYFGDDWHIIPLVDMPHYKFACGNEVEYCEYIDKAWRYFNLSPKLFSKRKSKQITTFRDMIQDISINGISCPISVVRSMDGRNVIMDGNHRASISKSLEIQLPIQYVDTYEYIAKLSNNEDLRYGSKTRGMPYQSVIYKGDVIVEGRRDDLSERFAMISSLDIIGKSVIDFGSNLGMGLVQSHEMGAKYVLGVEKEAPIAKSAIRLAVMMGYPLRTIVGDLSQPINLETKFDTGFCFSINEHVGNDDNLIANILNSGISVLYFECHETRPLPEFISKEFDTCEYLGKVSGSRKMYRLELS